MKPKPAYANLTEAKRLLREWSKGEITPSRPLLTAAVHTCINGGCYYHTLVCIGLRRKWERKLKGRLNSEAPT